MTFAFPASKTLNKNVDDEKKNKALEKLSLFSQLPVTSLGIGIHFLKRSFAWVTEGPWKVNNCNNLLNLRCLEQIDVL